MEATAYLDRNQKRFDGPLHYFLWKQVANLVPLDESTKDISDEMLRQSCFDLFHYIHNAFCDMVEKPQEYALHHDGEINAAIDEFVCFHITALIDLLTIAIDVQPEFMLISSADYDTIMQAKAKRWKSKKYTAHLLNIENCIKTLEQRGLKIERHLDTVFISSNRYPKMFLSAKLMRDADARQYKRTKRISQNLHMCDFRVLHEHKQKHEVDDVLAPFRDEEKECAHAVINYLASKNIPIQAQVNILHYRIAKFTYRKKDILLFRWNAHHYVAGFELGICLAYPGQPEYELIDDEINTLHNADEIKEFCSRNQKPCDFCHPNCVEKNSYKEEWQIFGHPMTKLISSCGGCLVCVTQVDENTLEYIKTLLDIHIRAIDYRQRFVM